MRRYMFPTVACLFLGSAILSANPSFQSGNSVRLSVMGSEEHSYGVAMFVDNAVALDGLDIPIRFAAPSDAIVLEEVEWAPRVADWDVKEATIDNNAKTAIFTLIANVGRARSGVALKVAGDQTTEIARLTFRVEGPVTVPITTFATRRPTHQLTYIFNDWSTGVPIVREITPTFESSVVFANKIVPGSFELHAPYPNPFNAEVRADFSVPVRSRIQLEVVNVLGQHVRTLADEPFDAGEQSLVWDGRNDQGTAVASGSYFLRMRAGDFESQRKVLLLR